MELTALTNTKYSAPGTLLEYNILYMYLHIDCSRSIEIGTCKDGLNICEDMVSVSVTGETTDTFLGTISVQVSVVWPLEEG